jgi:hypothetical protein
MCVDNSSRNAPSPLNTTGPWQVVSCQRENTTTLKFTQEQEERKITPQSFYVTVALATFWVIPRPQVTITIRSALAQSAKESFLVCVRRVQSSDRRTRHGLRISRPLSSPKAPRTPSSVHKSLAWMSIHLWHVPSQTQTFSPYAPILKCQDPTFQWLRTYEQVFI